MNNEIKKLLNDFCKENNVSVSKIKGKYRDKKTIDFRRKFCVYMFEDKKIDIKHIATLLNRSYSTIYLIINPTKQTDFKSKNESRSDFLKKIIKRKKEIQKELKLIENVLSEYNIHV